ncbi:MAG: hypothetical protein SGI77_26880 [Pirellulaceae bacterium]|nr:hypothetical protein [Pirellulaceae bacterium]
MTPRERILAIGVGAVVALAVGNYFWTSIRKGISVKQDRIERLESDISKRETLITDGLMDRNKLTAVTPTSLPLNSEQAVAQYHEWLIGLIEEAELTSPQQNIVGGETTEKGVFKRFKFQISGRGTIENLTKLLYAFYETNYLHRIIQLKILPVQREAYQLEISLVTEVLALNIASETQPAPTGKSPRIKKSLAEYSNEIVGRNLFSPANHPPRWSETASTEAVRGSPFSYDPGAKDVDAGQSVHYEIVGEAPEGFRIGKDGAEIDWMPQKIGTYVVTLAATDNGLPRQTSEQTLTIKVVDPPPVVEVKPEPKFDIASQAEVTGFVAGRDGAEVWVGSRLEGKTLHLKVGDKLTLGSVEGTVIAIGANYMELETEGKKWSVGLDESLADAYRRLKVD